MRTPTSLAVPVVLQLKTDSRKGFENWGIDRRARIRCPIELIERTGQTVDISSTGLRISSENKFSTGARIEVSVQWPSELEDGVHLQLVAVGKVVRCDEHTIAIEFHTYEFRTQSTRLIPAPGRCTELARRATSPKSGGALV